MPQTTPIPPEQICPYPDGSARLWWLAGWRAAAQGWARSSTPALFDRPRHSWEEGYDTCTLALHGYHAGPTDPSPLPPPSRHQPPTHRARQSLLLPFER